MFVQPEQKQYNVDCSCAQTALWQTQCLVEKAEIVNKIGILRRKLSAQAKIAISGYICAKSLPTINYKPPTGYCFTK